MERQVVYLVVEDELSEAVLRRIIRDFRKDWVIGPVYGRQGNTYLFKHIRAFNKAAQGIPHVLLTDLDDVDCPPTLVNRLFQPNEVRNLVFCIATREVETWIMADREGFARYLGIGRSLVPSDVETIDTPRETLISLAKRSRNRSIREDIVPKVGSTAKKGRGYNSALSSFVLQKWNVESARGEAMSLDRAICRISEYPTQ